MPEKTVIYGNIVGPEERDKIGRSFPESNEFLSWHSDSKALPNTEEQPSIVFIDLDNPKFAASEFLASLATSGKDVRIIGKSESSDLNEAIRVSKLGVSEILTQDGCFDKLCKILEDNKEDAREDESRTAKFGVNSLIGHSPQIAEIRKTINLLSDVDFPSALILGETGTGKSFISKILHNTGLRAKHNLVEVNCSAIPDELFESELFGHVKGAFTDARTEKVGLFEYAEYGTLFLDEVGSLTSSAQAKLLKIIEDKKLRRVGDVHEKDINVRVVAATNMDFSKAIEVGTFREDLFFRLNLLVIEIPPLRERPEDLEPLINHYLKYYAGLYNIPRIRISNEALESMAKYNWPGNVRELCNVIERAVLLSKSGKIDSEDVKAAFKRGRIGLNDRKKIILEVPDQGLPLAQIEQTVVKQVLDMCNWNKSEAAKFLDISRPRLRRILASSGVEQNRRER
jgi:DNA-binding NtrC family response regulator